MQTDLKQGLIGVVEKIIETEFGREFAPLVSLEIPKEKQFGDWSLNIAMKMSKALRRPPLELAKTVAEKLSGALKENGLDCLLARVEIKPPGFVNVFLSESALREVLNNIQKIKNEFGRNNLGKKEKVLLEFVSANPTGPLSIAHARQAAVGDTLANILNFCGYDVAREYYINDEGNQIRTLGVSLRARYLERLGKAEGDFPEDGYKGEYLFDMADALIAEAGDKYAGQPADEALGFFSEYAADKILQQIKEELSGFDVLFDFWYSQKKHVSIEKIKESIEFLRRQGYIYEQDGATWFKSTDLGDDKDRVVVKSDGQFTYLAPDIAYHRQKFARGFAKLIDILGPDHHGYINRLKAAVAALGQDPKALSVLIIQLATLYRDGKPVRMSTRAGEYVSLQELVQEVGKDAARFFFLMRKCDSQLEFDLELAKKHSMENPVYYVQYAHARISGIRGVLQTAARESGFSDVQAFYSAADLGLLKEDEAFELMRKLYEFNEVLETCAKNLEPQGLTTYLRELSGMFHAYYNKYRIFTEDKTQWDLSRARFYLVECVRQVIANGLELLRVSAPKEM